MLYFYQSNSRHSLFRRKRNQDHLDVNLSICFQCESLNVNEVSVKRSKNNSSFVNIWTEVWAIEYRPYASWTRINQCSCNRCCKCFSIFLNYRYISSCQENWDDTRLLRLSSRESFPNNFNYEIVKALNSTNEQLHLK